MQLKSLTSLMKYGVGLSVRGLEVAAKFGLYALAARILGGPGSGIFFLCLTLLHLVTTAARLGTERPIARNVAAYLASGQAHLAKRTILRALCLTLVTGFVAGAGVLFTAQWQAVSAYHQPDAEPALRLLALAIPAQVLAYTCGYILIGLERGAVAQLLMNAVAPLVTLIALVLGVKSLNLALVVYAAAYWACVVAGLALIWDGWRRRSHETELVRTDVLPSLLQSSKQFYIVELLQASLIAAPVIVLARFAEAAAVSQFSVANRLSMLVSAMVMSMGAMAAPTLAQKHRLGQGAELAASLRHLTLTSMVVCLPVIAVMILARHLLLKIMGADVGVAAEALVIMAAAQLVIAILPARDTLLAMSGHGAQLRTLSLMQGVVIGVGCAVLIPPFGAVGAALVSAGAWLVGGLGAELMSRRHVPDAYRRSTAQL
jgi:O-antigen/teichoic acid export membrane protein